MRDFTSLGRAIVDPTRVRIIAGLRRGELCVCELVDALEISQSTLSGHLQVLRQTGLVITRKEGRWIYYSLTDRKTALIEALFSHIQLDGDDDPLASIVIGLLSLGSVVHLPTLDASIHIITGVIFIAGAIFTGLLLTVRRSRELCGTDLGSKCAGIAQLVEQLICNLKSGFCYL